MNTDIVPDSPTVRPGRRRRIVTTVAAGLLIFGLGTGTGAVAANAATASPATSMHGQQPGGMGTTGGTPPSASA